MIKKILFLVLVVVVLGLGVWGYQNFGREETLKDQAWGVLEKYLEFAQKLDIEGVKSLSYQIGESCKDPSTKELKKDCDTRMASVYYFGSNLKKDDLTSVWSDSKQIILVSDLRREENENAIAYSRAIVYFIINENSEIKLLKFNDSRGVSMPKEGRTVEEIDTYLQKRMLDDDKDGIEDEIERCEGQPTNCKKTDPYKQDTDGDGFWDGVEAQFLLN